MKPSFPSLDFLIVGKKKSKAWLRGKVKAHTHPEVVVMRNVKSRKKVEVPWSWGRSKG
jgi:hypothetical protein